MKRQLRYDVPSADLLWRLSIAPLPGGMPATPLARSVCRESHLDTSSDTLSAHGLSCVVRIREDGRRLVQVLRCEAGASPVARSVVTSGSDDGSSSALPARIQRALAPYVDPASLVTRLDVRVEERVRRAGPHWVLGPRFELSYSSHLAGTPRRDGATFHEIAVRLLRGNDAGLEKLGRTLSEEHGLRAVVAEPWERARLLLKWMAAEGRAVGQAIATRVAVALIDGEGNCACRGDADLPLVAIAAGSGEGCARGMAAQLGGSSSELRRVGSIATADGGSVEVWVARTDAAADSVKWLPAPVALARAAAAAETSLLAVLGLIAGVGTVVTSSGPEQRTHHGPTSRDWPVTPLPPSDGLAPEPQGSGNAQFLNSELSLLEFVGRVLAIAENPATPLLERLRFLAIVSGNLDEFFMVRVGGLRRAASELIEERSEDGLTPQEQLEVIALRVPALTARQAVCFRRCAQELADRGVLRILSHEDLTGEQRRRLRDYFSDFVLPSLTPLAVTLSPGHPFPHLPHLSLSVAATLRDERGGPAQLVQMELPGDLPRFVPVDGEESRGFVLLEELVRCNLDALYPGRIVEETSAFRVTRAADLELEEEGADSLLEAVHAAAKRRGTNCVVRVEVERGMSEIMRRLLIAELERERKSFPASSAVSGADLYDVDGILDMRALSELGQHAPAGSSFPPLDARDPLPADADMWEWMRERERLVHHPFDSFSATVQRLIETAAADPAVTAIKITLYRAGESSPIVEALARAAAAGKEAIAFVELKARFDEERNVAWARRLEEAGAHVVYGYVGLKNHAKFALIARREADRTRRYVHVATGNYNADTACTYTDLGLFSADDQLGADIGDLFNELTGSSAPPQRTGRRSLVGPRGLLPGLLVLIQRECEHARAGRGGRIRIKVSGLSDPEVIRALYLASRAGVSVDLAVRGICTLRPGVPGYSENIRVRSVLGRFLEHSRIYHFGNAGNPEYFIGSADLRPRNLRRRVELLVRVAEPACVRELDRLLTLYMDDPSAWDLQPHGAYVRGSGKGLSVQERLAEESGISIRFSSAPTLPDTAPAPPA